MKEIDFIKENEMLLTKFDEMHQKLLKLLASVCSVWFMNILMKTLLQHKCKDYGGYGLSEEDLKLLTHADLTIVLSYLAFNVITLMDPRAQEALRKEHKDLKEVECGEQLDSLLLVLYNLQEMDWKEFRHHSPVISEDENSQEVLN